jgi:hypothetical protein
VHALRPPSPVRDLHRRCAQLSHLQHAHQTIHLHQLGRKHGWSRGHRRCSRASDSSFRSCSSSNGDGSSGFFPIRGGGSLLARITPSSATDIITPSQRLVDNEQQQQAAQPQV